MIQPDWKAIIDDMPPEQQAEVKRIADKMTYYLTHDRMIFDGMTRDPDRPITFRWFEPLRRES